MGFQKIKPENGFAPFFPLIRLAIQKIRFETILFFALFVTKETRQMEKMFFDDCLISDPDPALFFFLDPGRKRRVDFLPVLFRLIAIGLGHKGASVLFPDNLDDHAFAAAAVELAGLSFHRGASAIPRLL